MPNATIPMPDPIRVTARQEVTNALLVQGEGDAERYVEDMMKWSFAEELAKALEQYGTCIIGRIHDERRTDDAFYPGTMMRDVTVFERWGYIWPIPVPVEGAPAPQLQITAGWFR